MSEAIVTRVTLGQISDSILDLCQTDKIDIGQLRNAVDSSLARMPLDDASEKGTMSWKQATKKQAETFKLTERQVNKFVVKGGDNGLRFFLFNQEVLAMEQRVGTLKLAGWPTYLESWVAKFAKMAVPTP